MDLFSSRSRALTPELKQMIRQYTQKRAKPPSKRTVWLLGQQAAQNTRRTKAEAQRTVAGQTGAAEPSDAQWLAGALSEEGLDHYAVGMKDPEGNEFDIN